MNVLISKLLLPCYAQHHRHWSCLGGGCNAILIQFTTRWCSRRFATLVGQYLTRTVHTRRCRRIYNRDSEEKERTNILLN